MECTNITSSMGAVELNFNKDQFCAFKDFESCGKTFILHFLVNRILVLLSEHTVNRMNIDLFKSKRDIK